MLISNRDVNYFPPFDARSHSGRARIKVVTCQFERISMKFDVGEFYEKSSLLFGSHVSRIIVTATLREDLHAFLSASSVYVALNICLRKKCFSLKLWRRMKYTFYTHNLLFFFVSVFEIIQ